MTLKDISKLSFEQAMNELEDVVAKLEMVKFHWKILLNFTKWVMT